MTDQALSRVDKFLADVAAKPVSRGSLIFALDATGSRERTWDTAAELQTQMFREIAGLGSLDVQLVYFRGTAGFDAECKASGWVSNPMQLAKLMAKIRCETGDTQIRRVLDHALQETAKRKVDALVFVGDACEEKRNHLVTLAEELGRLKVPVFMFQEGRDQEAEVCFREIAERSPMAPTKDSTQPAAARLGELLKAVAAFAVGGVAALERQGSAAAKLLLGQTVVQRALWRGTGQTIKQAIEVVGSALGLKILSRA